ncbi:hypothetical protein [Streptomyces sp. WM6378]|uniref:hypothetical protein n=1 Tax=Streptomyces sp. WM6378 TaxID=1415557 RepID=UPI0006ADC823|nr:hypothetical protein [Streptomyces sp. WM6378]KOU41048.1 hypothetical protein ADK54_21055 [Streptomyces sp. WM6378]
MRKFQQVALVFAAAGGLSAIGVGSSSAVAPVAYNGAAPPPIGQPDTAHASSSSQAVARSYSTPTQPQGMSLPQPSEVSPQVNPQLNPLISPQISPQTAPVPGGSVDQNNLFRPSQECSPQNLLNANLPIAVLAGAETHGVSCTQANNQANALAHAEH